MALQDLSRECIRDTIMYKRDPEQWRNADFRALYSSTIQRLRAGQLAPHKENRLIAGRYLKMQTEKRSADEIIIFVCAGHVSKVVSTNPYTRVVVADYGFAANDLALGEAEDRADRNDMHIVFEEEWYAV